MSIPLGKTYQPDALEQSVIEFWRKNRTFQKSIENRAAAPPFVFLEGPPTANGLPHPGHVLTRTLKDAVCRYKTMRGFRVERKAGWDCHGLPVEIEVEKELGLKNKQDIERYGVAKFNQRCRESVFRYKKDWEWMSERVGFWLDFDHPYVTLENEYIESVWWSLKEAWKKELLFKGFRVAPYCPRCGTALSSHEVGLGYRSVEEPSVFVKFRIQGKPNEYFLAWTTTPWTLPGNVALAVGKDIDYVRVEQDTPKGAETYILAEACLGVLRPGHKILDRLKGSQLVGTSYEPLYPFLHDAYPRRVPPGSPPLGNGWKIHPADFVTTQDGTGIVHTAVMYGEDDFELGTRVGLPQLHTVKTDGTFEGFVKPWSGKFVKDADPEIIEDLRAKNLLYRVKHHTHDYPFCWRCNTPLLYYARDQWFLRMSALRDRLVKNNDDVQWVPGHVKEGRFGDFIRNVRDWALSRDRYWGTPLPIWTCSRCHRRECVGSLEELVRLGGTPVAALVEAGKLDLHKPAVDEIHLNCPKCHHRMDRDPSVIDTWYDSGAAQFAQWHYPFDAKNKSAAERPVDFIAEGIDQTRGWFYTLLAESTFLFDRASYRAVVVNGLVLDEKGQKMSKKLKNYTDPHEAFKTQGADAMRWNLLSSSAPFADKRFFPAAIRDSLTRFFLTLWNTFQFYRSYAEFDRWKPAGKAPPVSERALLDRWLVARLETVSAQARREGDAYNLHKAANAIESFVLDDLSNWWLRRSRRRFWTESDSRDKLHAYWTLHEALLAVARLAAPYAPFLPEALHANLRTPDFPESVHFSDYPAGTDRKEPTNLERAMDEVRRLAEGARSLRNKAGIKNRIPLARLTLVRPDPPSPEFQELMETLKEEANVKSVLIAKGAQGLEEYQATIQQAPVGRELKAEAKPVLEAARLADPKTLGRRLATDGHVTLAGRRLDARFFTLTTVATEGTLKADVPGAGTLFLDAHLTPELEAEGWARELVRRIQEMRKEAHLELDDQIETNIVAAPSILASVRTWSKFVQDETRSRELRIDGQEGKPRRAPAAVEPSLVKEWDIEGEKVTIQITKATP